MPISPHLAALPSLSPPAGCLLAGCWCLLCRTGCGEISQHISLIVEGRGPSYVHKLELPREQTMPASFPPRPPGARASDGALFLTFGLAEFVYVYYTRSKWDDG